MSLRSFPFSSWLSFGGLGSFGLVFLSACPPPVVVIQKKTLPLARWIKQLRLGSADEKKEAAAELGKIGPDAEKAIPELRQVLLADPQADVRKAACEALQKIGSKALASWLRALQDKDTSVRQVASDAILQEGAGLLEPLKELLASSLGEERLASLLALRVLRKQAKPWLKAIAQRLTDSEVDVRKTAAEILGSFGPEGAEAIPELVLALRKNQDWWNVRKAILQAIGQIGPAAKDAIPGVVLMMDEKDDDVRKEAYRTLEKLGPDVVKNLGEAFIGASWWAKTQILKMLELFGARSAPAVPSLVIALDDPDQDVRRAILRTLARLGHAASASSERLYKILADPKEPHQSWMLALSALLKFGPVGTQTLHRALQHPDWWLPKTLSEAFGQLGSEIGTEGLPILTLALAHSRWEIRWTATLVLQKFGKQAISALPALRPLLRDPERSVRLGSIRAIASIGPSASDALPDLRPLQNDGDSEIRDAASQALRRLQRPD